MYFILQTNPRERKVTFITFILSPSLSLRYVTSLDDQGISYSLPMNRAVFSKVNFFSCFLWKVMSVRNRIMCMFHVFCLMRSECTVQQTSIISLKTSQLFYRFQTGEIK